MARQVKLLTRELGELNLYIIRSRGGVWEVEWEPIRATSYATYLTVLPKDTLDHALHGWTSPLVKALGPSPKMILHRLSPDARQCVLSRKCVFYRATDCVPNAAKMPNCFQPIGVPVEQGYELLRLWRESVYVVVEDTP